MLVSTTNTLGVVNTGYMLLVSGTAMVVSQ